MTAPVITARTDPRYLSALARRCTICKAKPQEDCTNTITPGQPIPGRLVHTERMTEATEDE